MKRTIKLTFQITVALVILLLLAALITGCVIMFGSVGTKGQFTYLFVLGTTVDGTEPSPMLADRIEAAAKYLEKNPDVIAVVTGGKADDENISEAQCMYNSLTALGIDPGRILLEDQATSTAENFKFSIELLEQELGYRPEHIGVLSSEFHLARSKMIGKSYDLKISTVPAPTSDAKTFFKYFLREIPVFWFDALKAALR